MYNNSGETYEQAYEKYSQEIANRKAKTASLDKAVEDARAYYLSGLSQEEIKPALAKLTTAIDAASAFTPGLLPPRKEDFTKTQDIFSTSQPETNVNKQVSQEFLNEYIETQIGDVAQALPAGPLGMDRAPGTYHPSNIMPLQTPGSTFRPGEAWMIQDPFKNSPQTAPGLSSGPDKEAVIAKTPSKSKEKNSFSKLLSSLKDKTLVAGIPAVPMGPYTPVRNFGTRNKPFIGPSTKDTHNNPSGERVIQMRWEAKAPFVQQSLKDKLKALNKNAEVASSTKINPFG
jgi:hypothetical protein